MKFDKKINWQEIFNGEEHLLVEGEDYKRTSSFTKYLYQKAREYGVRIRQKVSQDNKSILVQVQVKINELVVKEKILIPDIVSSGEVIDRPKFEEDLYPFMEWFAELLLGGTKEVDVYKKDEFGRPIPIMKKLPDGFEVPSGEFESYKQVINFSPNHYLELRYPHDFDCTPKKMAALFCEAARRTGRINVKELYFQYGNKIKNKLKRTDFLIIYAGRLAELQRDLENAPDSYNLWTHYDTKNAIPLTRQKVDTWKEMLERDGQVMLWELKDYAAGMGKHLATLLHQIYPDLVFYAKEVSENDSQEGGGWKILLLTLRKPMLSRFAVLDKEKPEDFVKRWKEAEEGKLIEQPIEQQKIQLEEQKFNESIEQKRLVYVQTMNRFNIDLAKAIKDPELEFMQVQIKKQIEETRKEYSEWFADEELKQLEVQHVKGLLS